MRRIVAPTSPRLALTIMAAAMLAQNATAQVTSVRHEVVHAGSATIAVTVFGKGEPIVFIPSRGRSAEDFHDLSTQLVNAGYQAVLPEPRGINGSSGPTADITYHDLASDLARVIESLVGRPAIITGHDFGNRIARTLASDHPTLVKQLILLSAGGMVPRSPEMEKLTTHFWDSALSQEDRLKTIRQMFFAPGKNPKAWEKGWYFDVARAQRASDGRTPMQEWWAGGSAPMLVLQCAEDRIAIPENARRLKDQFPDRVTIIEIAHCGHAMLPEQPKQVAKAIIDYLRQSAR